MEQPHSFVPRFDNSLHRIKVTSNQGHDVSKHEKRDFLQNVSQANDKGTSKRHITSILWGEWPVDSRPDKGSVKLKEVPPYISHHVLSQVVGYLLSGVPDYFYRNKISSGGDLSHYSSASLY